MVENDLGGKASQRLNRKVNTFELDDGRERWRKVFLLSPFPTVGLSLTSFLPTHTFLEGGSAYLSCGHLAE